ncbi:MAG: hypothetical protein LBF78_00730 [Treponema sp.]|jgi:hypothetical protein|nr:hypothetical protein [Treponema sp.]
MGDEKKSNIHKAIELLEENGFYVFKAEEEVSEDGYPYPGEGTIELKMVRQERVKHQ